jgi:predicted phosphodiesterase
MAVFLTGDTHNDFSRLSFKKWKLSKTLTKKDLLIVPGDFGLIFNNTITKDEKYHTAWLNNRPYSIAFVDGNHENHPRLNALPEKEMFGGTVGVIADTIYHFKRGEVYTIEDKKFFTFGGASSIDKNLRIPWVSWWKEEIASPAEMDHGLQKLEEHQYAVDYILAHTAPEDVAQALIKNLKSYFVDNDPTRKYLEHVCSCTTFKEFYCGHWHVQWVTGKYNFLYENIIQIL